MFLLRPFLTFSLIVILLFISLRYIEGRTLFYPTKSIASSPGQVGLKFQDVFFKTSDHAKLNGWFIPAPNAVFTILFCHGNAGNISHRIEKLKFFNKCGYSVFIFDYEGYGKSEGRPSEKKLYQDADAAYQYLLSSGIPASRIIGYGESIGGAVVVDLASRQTMRAVILDSTLTSVKDMIKQTYPFLPYWVFRSRFDSETKIKNIKIPKLLIHSKDDEIIPYRLGTKLFKVASPPKEFLEIRGGHNSNFFESQNSLEQKISGFIRQL